MANEYPDHDERDALPTDLHALHHQLQADSAAWSRHVPSSERLIAHYRTLVERQHVTQASTSDATVPALHPPVFPEGGHMHSLQQRIGVVFAALIVVAAIFGFVVLRNHQADNKGTHTNSVTPATATPIGASIPTTWTHVSALDYRGQYVNENPAIAPSDPNVVYETYGVPSDSNITEYRRTDDGGKTWHELTLPVPNNTGKTYFRTYVSPLDPKTIFLQVFEGMAIACPTEFQTTVGSETGGPYCAIQFISTDAGVHWSFQHLPNNGTFADHLFSNQRYLRAQGTRLYATEECYNTDCDNILTSTDGGKNWTVISTALVANGHTLCDFHAAANSSTIMAITSTPTGAASILDCYSNAGIPPKPLTLWQSNDAGATWQNEGLLPTVLNQGTDVTNDSLGRSIIYSDSPAIARIANNYNGGPYPVTIPTVLPSDIKVTTDSGKTWSSAPTTGVPASLGVVRLVGTLPDSSVLIECAPLPPTSLPLIDDSRGSTYFYWKPGDASWQQLGNATIGNFQGFLVTPDATKIGMVWLMLSGMGSASFGVYTI